MSRVKSAVFKMHFRLNRIFFFWILIVSTLFTLGVIPGNIVYQSAKGEESSKTARSLTGQAIASKSADGKKVIFTTSDGTVVQSIPVVKKKVESSKTPAGDNITYTSDDFVRISDDRRYVAIFTRTYEYYDGAVESILTVIFRYFDSSGKLWEKKGEAFETTGRVLSSDGSRILLYDKTDGAPSGVYSKTGQLLIPLSLGFADVSNIQISPNGKYIFAEGISHDENERKSSDSVKVIDIGNNRSSDFPYEIEKGAIDNLHISSDGRFEFEYLGKRVVLPK